MDGSRRNQRKSIRLAGYDYRTPGAYFITVCSHKREFLFGEVLNGVMNINECGQIVQSTWDDLIHHNAGIELGEFVVMPNHIHGVIIINDVVGAGSEPAPTDPAPTELARTDPARTPPLSEIVRQFKTFSARRINALRKTPGVPVWQRNYWEHIIRSEESYARICDYIVDNPLRWEEDDLFNG